jgi:hypothetical protein
LTYLRAKAASEIFTSIKGDGPRTVDDPRRGGTPIGNPQLFELERFPLRGMAMLLASKGLKGYCSECRIFLQTQTDAAL